jgi:lipopolysaccharide/colanic/teichoic acid biosynthesis glycosyltransferase
MMGNVQVPAQVEVLEYKDAMSGFERFVKRSVDFIAAFCGIAVLLPVLLFIYVVILLAGGDAIYKQERIGYKGKTFTIYKFRTMKKDAEKNGIPRTEEERREQMTKIGQFLRDHHLDELPQLFNVLNGDMSLVGPRPERQVFIDKIMAVNPNYVHVYKMRPGLTSQATLYNGYTDTMEKMLTRLDMDLEYLTTRSLWGDLMIIFKTVFSIISGKKF